MIPSERGAGTAESAPDDEHATGRESSPNGSSQLTSRGSVVPAGSRSAVANRPSAMPVDTAAAFPESLRYRLKNKLLGPPLTTDRLAVERLGKLAGLGVLAPDMISSSAYGTEEMLTQLVPGFGLAAFSLVVPVTLVILAVLLFVTLSYLEVIKAYTKAGGSYVVARDNFGPRVALVAAVALLIDYTVTVAVQCTAGTDALTSLVPSLTPYTVPITVGVVVVLCYGNLRGIREGARAFAVPTYLFVLSLGSVVVVGLIRKALGDVPRQLAHQSGMLPFGHHSALIAFAGVTIMLKAFANGGSSLTGLEAISNSVGAFRPPQARNGRVTLVIMSSVLGFLVLGVSLLAHWSHASPFKVGSPTVIAQVAGWVYGTHGIGGGLHDVVVFATMLILFTGGNTSFNGFPYLASFVAADSFMPRQLTRRGHRLAFSNGIVALAVVGIALVIGTGANLTSLVALYAIGVFTGFTMAGAGMVKHHRTVREPGWAYRQVINGSAAVLSLIVVLIFAVFKFTEGAWLVVVAGPVLYLLLLRLHRQYAEESKELEVSAAEATEAPLLRRHVVVVLVDRLDMATARAIQYARTLSPDDLRAVHFDIDSQATQELVAEWGRLGLSRLPLDVMECPDRRLGRAAVELVADAVADGDTECTILLPRRGFVWGWQRLLHDRTADKIAAVVSQVPHVSATIIPFNLLGAPRPDGSSGLAQRMAAHAVSARLRRGAPAAGREPDRGKEGSRAAAMSEREPRGSGSVAVRPARPAVRSPKERPREKGTQAGKESDADRRLASRAVDTSPIGLAEWRRRVRVAGRIKSVTVQPRAGTSNLECVIADRTGAILLVFQGRPRIPGIEPGARLVVEGMVGAWGRRLAILNPDYELVAEHGAHGNEPA